MHQSKFHLPALKLICLASACEQETNWFDGILKTMKALHLILSTGWHWAGVFTLEGLDEVTASVFTVMETRAAG